MTDIFNSVVLITNADASNRKFGSGFAFYREPNAVLILTCAHVLDDVGGPVRVEGKEVEIVARGTSDEVDMAVLRVQGLGTPPLLLGSADKEDMDCTIVGFASLSSISPVRRAEPLQGKSGSRVVFVTPKGIRVEVWRLWIDSKVLLEGGYSGSPVIDSSNGTVFAVTSHSIAKGESGYAVSLANLPKIWPEMPPGLLQTAHPAQSLQPTDEPMPAIDFLKLLQVFSECESIKIKGSRIALLNFSDPQLQKQCDNFINDTPRDFAMNICGLIKKAQRNGTSVEDGWPDFMDTLLLREVHLSDASRLVLEQAKESLA